MRHAFTLAAAFAASSLHTVTAQDAQWCKDAECADCPSGLASNGPGYPECVIYDSNTVFGGQGFPEGEGQIKYLVNGKFADPCGGSPGSYMVRSPASLTTAGCGNLIYHTEGAECSGTLRLQDTFMIQFCCGSGDCQAAGVPWGKRGLGQRFAGGMSSALLKFANGTEIQPLAVGKPPEALAAGIEARQECQNGYKTYTPDGADYLTTKGTQIVSRSVGPYEEDTTITITYDQTISTSVSFSATAGDPLGIISVTVGFEFTQSESKGFQANVPVYAGESGRVGFTPVYRCTSGTLTQCDGVTTETGEACTPWVVDGLVQGDYLVVQT